ncbi:Acetylxylan esterase [termite gut metagenome]|uniref:Acetylxylan esterase n=1 Tax=termite gut metagenome TaxID=433724 RepID=A0A5J4SV95_9ZZZZ
MVLLSVMMCQWNVVDAQLLIKDGETVAFMGNSITAQGWKQGGYVRLIVSALESVGIKITPIPAGISGNKSNDMLARLDKDILSKHPDWMTLSCGVNDVWHGERGVELEDYKKNITEIVDHAITGNVKVILLTATVIGEEDNNNNRKLAGYNNFLRQLAKERGLPLADLNADFQEILGKMETTPESRYLTSDGVHMKPEGNVLMAKGCLRAMGFTDEQIKKGLEEKVF